jgi:hypothetical protein
MHEDIFTVLARDEAEALRVIEPLHSTLFHLIVFPGLNCAGGIGATTGRNLAWLGRVLLLPGSVLTLGLVYHRRV